MMLLSPSAAGQSCVQPSMTERDAVCHSGSLVPGLHTVQLVHAWWGKTQGLRCSTARVCTYRYILAALTPA